MKRLVLCFDGTWNALSDPNALTNVVTLANLVTVNHDNVEQITYYNSGVGSGGPIDRFIGGAFGAGLKSNVKRGLAFLALNYDLEDEIYLFGFSRGAYTARALAGVIGSAGIPRDIRSAEQHWDVYQQMAKLRPNPHLPKDSPKRLAATKAIEDLRTQLVKYSRNTNDAETKLLPVKIKCVGVWDTVGSYGIPSGFGLRSLPRIFTYWTRGFRDTHFGAGTVQLGLHAVALDERRRPFTPTFWTLRPRTPDEPGAPPPGEKEKPLPVDQVWFAGVHSNVGGGYPNHGLSDLALAWMMAQVQEKTGLRFNESEAMRLVWPCTACTLYHTSKNRWFNPVRPVLPKLPDAKGLWWTLKQLLGFRQRRFVRVNEEVHWSVKERRGWSATLVDNGDPCKYTPANLGSDLKAYSAPMRLELVLLDHSTRNWAGHCPMENKGQACQCKTRDIKALAGGGAPAAKAPFPSAAA
jgi:uncharacterized protein (DUF2235 family)